MDADRSVGCSKRRPAATRGGVTTLLAAVGWLATVEAAGLPVTFEIDDPRDGLYEAASVALRDLHVAEQVPVTFQVVPCGVGSRLSPYQCVNTTGFHRNWGDWMRANPDLIDVGQHGNNHTEMLTDLTRAEQLDLVLRGLEEMSTWGMPPGSWNLSRPLSFAAPFASSNADTVSVLAELAFHTSVKNSGDCFGSTQLDVYCQSVPLCELNPQGGRVSGPSCVIKPPETLIQQVNARAGEGKVFIVYHAQDVVRSDLTTVDPAKMDSLRAVLQAFRDQEIAGSYDLMTLDTHYRILHGVPTPGPGATLTPTGPVPTATPTPTGPLPTATPAPPAPTPVPGSSSIEVYQESLASPWIDASWSASVDFASTTRAFSGTRSIRIAQVAWGALSVHNGPWTATQPLDPDRYLAVELQIFPENSGMNVALRLENDQRESFPLIATGLAPVGAWKRISVPMSQLNPERRLFDRIDVSNANGTNVTYSVDELLVVGAASPTPTPGPPTPTPTQTPTAPPTATPTSSATETPAPPTATPAPPTVTPPPTATVGPPTPTPTPCPTSLSPTSATHGRRPSRGSIAVSAGSGCGWSVTSRPTWVTIESGASGVGDGTVGYFVQQNNGRTSRTGTLVIGTSIFTITQER